MGKLKQIKSNVDIVPIYNNIKPNCNDKKTLHAIDIELLMHPKFANHAIRLQLDNLILTYGLDNVLKYFNETIKEAV